MFDAPYFVRCILEFTVNFESKKCQSGIIFPSSRSQPPHPRPFYCTTKLLVKQPKPDRCAQSLCPIPNRTPLLVNKHPTPSKNHRISHKDTHTHQVNTKHQKSPKASFVPLSIAATIYNRSDLTRGQ